MIANKKGGSADFPVVQNGPSCPLIPIISYNNLININKLFIRLNEKFKIKQCSDCLHSKCR